MSSAVTEPLKRGWRLARPREGEWPGPPWLQDSVAAAETLASAHECVGSCVWSRKNAAHTARHERLSAG